MRLRREKTAQDDLLHFRLGEIGISLRSEPAGPREDFASLYRPFRLDHPGPGETIRMEVRKAGRCSRRFAIVGDGEPIGKTVARDEVMPYLEWGINWRVIARFPEFLQLHAASLARMGQAVIFAGDSGRGKSTLSAALLARGWKYLSDEFALVQTETLRLHPFPKAVCLKEGAFDVVNQLDLSLWQRRYFIKALKGRVGYLCPHDVAPRPIADPSPIRFVVFPKYTEGAAPRLQPLSRAEAAFSLARSVMNRDAVGHCAVSILAEVVRNADCFVLESGPIAATCDLLDALFAS
jgi:HprK-related kinase A